jgi:hypothetical protein
VLRYSVNYSLSIGSGLSGSTVTVGQKKVTTITGGAGSVTWTLS